MAEQSHILKLKATLDTSEVQKKLNQLRQTQKNALNGSNRVEQGNINFGSLASTLNRLNSTMMQMQRSLQQLVTRNIGSNVALNRTLPFTPILPFYRRMQVPQETPRRIITTNHHSSNLGVGNLHRRIEDPGRPLRPVYSRSYNPDSGHLRKIIIGRDYEWVKNFNPWFNKVTSPTQKWIRARNGGSTPFNTMYVPTMHPFSFDLTNKGWNTPKPGLRPKGPYDAFKGPLFGLFAGQAMDSYSSLLMSQGMTGASDAVKLGGGLMTGAATGTMFGPAGMAIGAVVGGLSDALQILTRRTTELANAFENQKTRISSAQKFDETLKSKVQNETDSKRLAVGDKVYFKNRISFKQKLLNKLNKQQEEIGIEPGSLTAYEEETLNKISQFRLSSPTGELPEYIKRRQRLADRYKTNVGTIDQIKSDIKRYEGNLKSLGVYNEEEQELIDFKKRAPRDMNSTLEAQRHVWQGDVDRLERKKAYWQAHSEETGNPIDLQVLEDLEKELKGYKDKIAVINDELNKRDQILKEQKIEWATTDLNNLQDRLSNLKNPNMSNVNSIAQFGFGINKNDDEIRFKMQVNYQKEQTQIQREIRDKVLEIDGLTKFN